MSWKYPTKTDLYHLCRVVKCDISDEYRADEFADEPSIQLTVGSDPISGKWGFQTGDNSYSGAAYHYPDWAVVALFRDSNCREVASEIRDQLSELACQRG